MRSLDCGGVGRSEFGDFGVLAGDPPEDVDLLRIGQAVSYRIGNELQ